MRRDLTHLRQEFREIRRQSRGGPDYASRRRLFAYNRLLAQRGVIVGIYLAGTVLALLLLLLLLNRLQGLRFSGMLTSGRMQYEAVPLSETLRSFLPLWGMLLLLALAGLLRLCYHIGTSFGDLNTGQKGTARWTTRQELEAQYKKVPQKETAFSGLGGLPVARAEDGGFYIDDTTTNNLILGGTRSGKGQLVLEPMAEIYSRAEEKASLILTDPKLELASHMMPELQRRGYRCYLLNLVDPEVSMGYNPLQLIIEEYKRGNLDTAQLLCSSLAYQIFPDKPEEKDPFWRGQARNVLVAMIWAELTDNLAMDRLEDQRKRHAQKQAEDVREEAYLQELYGEQYGDFCIRRELDRILAAEPELPDAGLLLELQVRELSGNETISVSQCTEADIRRLRAFPYRPNYFQRKAYQPEPVHEKAINLYSIIKMCSSLSSIPLSGGRTALDAYFEERPEEDFARITYGSIGAAAESTKGSILSTFREGVTVFTYSSMARLTAESSLDLMEVGFGKEPTCIFIGIPDYDASRHFLASVFISQLYFVLARLATAMPDGKLPRRTAFLLDEFGNLPALSGIGNMVTVCLGRNILFSFFVQSMQQLEKLYPEDAKTIAGNCGNRLYLMSGDLETCRELSELLGKETVTAVNRSGKRLSLHKELTEQWDERPLLTPDELMRLEMGETILIRFMFRQAQMGNPKPCIQATPIANLGRHRMPYAYTYLQDIFPAGQMLYESPLLVRVQECSPESLGKPAVSAEVRLERTDCIDHLSRSRSAAAWQSRRAWEQELFPVGTDLEPEELMRMAEVFDLLNLSREEREQYLEAGSLQADPQTGELRPRCPEKALTNGQLQRYAEELMQQEDREIAEKGYRLADLLDPLPEKETI